MPNSSPLGYNHFLPDKNNPVTELTQNTNPDTQSYHYVHRSELEHIERDKRSALAILRKAEAKNRNAWKLLLIGWAVTIGITFIMASFYNNLSAQVQSLRTTVFQLNQAIDVLKGSDMPAEYGIAYDDEPYAYSDNSSEFDTYKNADETLASAPKLDANSPSSNPIDDAGESVISVPTSPTSTLEATVRQWALAWQNQSAEQYLANYSESFTPPNNQNRSAWERNRKSRIAAPASIEVRIEDFNFVDVSRTTAVIEFTQHYRTPTYKDVVTKRMHLSNDGSHWLIDKEETVK